MDSQIASLLQQIKTNDLENDVPSISLEVAEFLHGLILAQGAKSALEIGCAHAYSTIWLAHALAQNQGTITSIDHSTPSFAAAQKNVLASNLDNIKLHFGRAQEVIPTLNGNFDFIFIDGIKKSTLEFFHIATPRLNNNGIIVIDDVLKFKHKMQTFWDYIETQDAWSYQVHKLDSDDGIMVIKQN